MNSSLILTYPSLRKKLIIMLGNGNESRIENEEMEVYEEVIEVELRLYLVLQQTMH